MRSMIHASFTHAQREKFRIAQNYTSRVKPAGRIAQLSTWSCTLNSRCRLSILRASSECGVRVSNVNGVRDLVATTLSHLLENVRIIGENYFSAVMHDLFDDKLGLNGIKQEGDEYNLGLDDNFDLLKFANDPTLAQAAQLPKVTQFEQPRQQSQALQQTPQPLKQHTHLQHLLSSDINSLQSELQLTQQTQLQQAQQEAKQQLQQTIKIETKPEPTNSPPPPVTTVNASLLSALQQSSISPQNLQQLLQAQLTQQLAQQQQQQQVQTTTQILQQQAINLLTQTQQPSSPPTVTQTAQTTTAQNVKTQKTILAVPVQQQTAATTSPTAQIIINAPPQQPAISSVGQLNLQQLQQVKNPIDIY